MSIPSYEECMLPLMKLVKDGKEYKFREVVDKLIDQFDLSDAEKQALLPSGSAFVINSRIGWARTYLSKAQLLEKTSRGVFKITERGQAFLKNNPLEINTKLLRQFDEFNEFQNKKSTINQDVEDQSKAHILNVTPQESMENGYVALKQELTEELLNLILKISPTKFENLVVELLVKMGYGGSFKEAATVVGKSGDAGIDGIIKEDKLGLDLIYIQAKKWEATVGRPEIQKFAGALMGKKAKKGIFITNSNYSSEAINYVENIDTKIILIDGEKLASLMIENNLGVNIQNVFEIKKIDFDYFEE